MNVIVRVPDGIVVASDSLASQHHQMQIPPVQVPYKCGSCNHEEEITVNVAAPQVGIPVNSSPLATKLFYIGHYAVSFHGAAAVGGRTLCNHVLNYVHTGFEFSKTVRDVAEDLSVILHDGLKKDMDVDLLGPEDMPIGFQIAGYNSDDLDLGSTFMVGIGKECTTTDTKERGVTFGGQVDIASRIYRRVLPTDNVSLDLTTLPDAVDYAKFLIRTTADYQRFAKQVPTVGGPVDVAIITKWAGFRWVERKTLLGSDEVRLNVGKVAEEMRSISRRQDELALQFNGLPAAQG